MKILDQSKIKDYIFEINDINNAIAVLSWDQETCMPRGGIAARSNQIATLSKISHEKSSSKEYGDALEEYTESTKNLDDDDSDKALATRLKKDYDRVVDVPVSLVMQLARATSKGQEAWARARTNSNFSEFKNELKEIVKLKKEYASIFSKDGNTYDVLLDEFEPGITTKEVKETFDSLREEQVELLKEIYDAEPIETDFLYKHYDKNKQIEFGESVASKFGYDWNRGRQDETAHPFTTNFSIDDVRITTRVNEEYLPTALFGTLHEVGHAMYEQGVAKKFERTPLGTGASLAIHESQSRFWENIIGRSYNFWQHFYPDLKRMFPEQLLYIDFEQFFRGINVVQPTPIRVEADEATYNLHVMLRFEIETELFSGKIDVKDIPEIWNTKTKDYLGITPRNDSEGALQDIHWSLGAFGYFPTYALGNLISAQIWERINQDIPNVKDQVLNGQFEEILKWQQNNIHQYGAKYQPKELIKKFTNSNIDTKPYMDYLKEKYRRIYKIK